MKTAVLFDLGNTLVEYYSRARLYEILELANREVHARLREHGSLRVTWDIAWERVRGENGEQPDFHVVPLIDRLSRVFELEQSDLSPDLANELCRCWLRPIFACARRYDDSLPVLQELRQNDYRTAIVSNTPWGSPGELWREEMRRLGLAGEVDEVVFCTDVGWRKPARQIFEYAMGKLGVGPDECVFVGDDPRWDIAGPEAIGMDAILIDRSGAAQNSGENAIRNLRELVSVLSALT